MLGLLFYSGHNDKTAPVKLVWSLWWKSFWWPAARSEAPVWPRCLPWGKCHSVPQLLRSTDWNNNQKTNFEALLAMLPLVFRVVGTVQVQDRLTENACHALSVSPCTLPWGKCCSVPQSCSSSQGTKGLKAVCLATFWLFTVKNVWPVSKNSCHWSPVKGSGANVLALLHTDQPQINNCNAEKISSNLDLFDGQNISMLLESDSYGPTRLLWITPRMCALHRVKHCPRKTGLVTLPQKNWFGLVIQSQKRISHAKRQQWKHIHKSIPTWSPSWLCLISEQPQILPYTPIWEASITMPSSLPLTS